MSDARGVRLMESNKKAQGRLASGSYQHTRQAIIARGLALGGAGALAACSPLGAEAPQPSAKRPVTIDYWTWFGPESLAGQQPMLDAFKQRAPHVTIQYTGTGHGEFLNKITTGVAGGTPPDVAYLDNQFQGFFGKQKLLVDQGPLGKKDREFRADLVDDRALKLYTYDGAVLGYPWALTTGQVFFNRELFRAAGRTLPDELFKQGRWTWAAMTEAAIALTRRAGDGTVQQLGLAHMSIWRLALNANGTDLFDDFRRPKKSRLDEPAAIEALEYVHDVAHKHRAAWKQPEAQELGGNANNAYDAGRVAMLVSWGTSARWAQVTGSTSAVPWPKGPAQNGTAAADLTTEAAGILRTSKVQEAAWEFCRWYQKEWQRVALSDRSKPANARVASRSDLYELSRAALAPAAPAAPVEMWFELAKNGVSRPVFPDWNKVNAEIINAGLNPVWAGQRSPRDAGQAVAKQLNDFFAANPQ